MRKTSVRDLHINTSELVREAAEGATIIIERRGQPVAELRPLTPERTISPKAKAKMFADMRKIWGTMPLMPDSTQAISEDRDR